MPTPAPLEKQAEILCLKCQADAAKAGVPLDEFLDDFPTVSKEQAVALLDIANKLLTSKNVAEICVKIL